MPSAMAKFAASPSLVALLAKDVHKLLGRITESHLRRYVSLQGGLAARDVGCDREYQRIFKGFYKMGRRDEAWYDYYFGLLQASKLDKSITFGQVLERIYADREQVEASFSSKLVATIRPQLPVYDKHVRDNLSLEIPPTHWPAGKRLAAMLGMYQELEAKVAALVRDPIFAATLRPAFDAHHPAYAHISDVKKLDLLLWQHRRTRAS